MEGAAYRTDVSPPAAVGSSRQAAAVQQRGQENDPSKLGFSRSATRAPDSGSRDLNSRLPGPVPRPACAGCWPSLQLRDSSDYVFKSQLIGVLQTLQQQVSAARG